MKTLWLGGWGVVTFMLATACGGTMELVTDKDDGKVDSGGRGGQGSSGSAGRGGSGSSDSGSPSAGDASLGGSGDPKVDPTEEPLTGCSGDPAVLGWQWNTACAYDVNEYCERDGATCYPSWDQAQKVQAWCGKANVSAVALIPSCQGYDVVSVFGADVTGDDPSLFNTYYYDSTTGDLLHIDTNRIPSCTQCQGGDSGSKFDVVGCEYQHVECPN